MKKIKWDKLYKNIPSKIHVNSKISYEVLRVNEFASNPTIHGETRFDPNQVVLAEKWPTKEKVHTLWHEIIHIISEQYDAKLTETQVCKLEKSLPFMIRFFRELDGRNE